ncbi:glycosyl hydrolase [Arcticibacter eurypsychrophilus]|uniref:glycosyl hydrolase n=1 Tax=Arcticibacter eurypsychrophilus TaxID=1434752 RepID=UPI00084DD4D8|nr:glycosyl hydrolase [Arcticibacter eurypsychrophilus]
MMRRCCLLLLSGLFCFQVSIAQSIGSKQADPAKPWVFWYWMQASFSKQGITKDLEAMKEAGIAGAYLAPIKGKTNPPLYTPVVEQLSPEWWKMVRFALDEADRLGIKIAMLPNDGFATAGGPWITPELSMQKVVWTETRIKGGQPFADTLSRPSSYQGYYKDIAVLAYPTSLGSGISTFTTIPKVTNSIPGKNASFLIKKSNKENFASTDPCWIQYEFEQPFTCRTVTIHVNSFNNQSQRLTVEASDNGTDFKKVTTLQAPRSGWLDWDADVTNAIAPVTARFFRFVYDREGTEPGGEDLDGAKWKQNLKIAGITLSSAARVHQFEGKTGEVWRVSTRTTQEQLPSGLAVPLNKIINITDHLDYNNRLTWTPEAGDWTILRIGHTSTGHMNETAGAGKGLESDKFNPEAAKLQFDKWFGEAVRVAGPDLTARVLKVFHVDSWECGSQNWSPVFQEEFKKRRGYDLTAYLPVMAGIPVQDAEVSERFLYDVRQTIAEVLQDNFFKVLRDLAHEKGATFTAETTAPIMTADGLMHFRDVDVPMGEFWLRSPSHDKPNDMMDAISAAHIYGKPIVQAEAFTELRMAWDEHPGMLKTLQDRNYALGINRLVYHVFTHNPWPDRKPGMTLDGVGLLFQRDQTWWKPGKAWVDYAQRSQVLLQKGSPVTDIAVFTGEEIPRRAILPDRLVSTLPGIFGKERVRIERIRKENKGLPMKQMPAGVNVSANLFEPQNWLDPLRGYAYDSFNPDALLRLATVKDGRVDFPGGASYALLVFPGKHPMQPNSQVMSVAVAEKILELVQEGATVLLAERPVITPGLASASQNDQRLSQLTEELWGGAFKTVQDGSESFRMKGIKAGRVILGPFAATSFDKIGIKHDVEIRDKAGERASGFVWTHRKDLASEIYFIANQDSVKKTVSLFFRVTGKAPEFYNAVTGASYLASQYVIADGVTTLNCQFEPNASVFVQFKQKTSVASLNKGNNWKETQVLQTISKPWMVQFDQTLGGPEKAVDFKELSSWSENADSLIRNYSGTASYASSFKLNAVKANEKVWLNLGEISNIAEVEVNGINCGVIWTAPYRADVTKAIRKGNNKILIRVTNTWANRLMADQRLPEDKRITRTTAPFRLDGKPLLKGGLIGPVTLIKEK